MSFDPGNPVIQLCAEGMALETQGKREEAHRLFLQAWHIATNDFEAFTAAHYVARNQGDPNENLRWNLEALNRALLVKTKAMQGHYPSLYLNIGKSYETLGNQAEAARHYQLAAASSAALPPGPYGHMIRSGISEGLTRTGAAAYTHRLLEELINSWCETKALRPLACILPAYVGNLGTDVELDKLCSALSYLSATRCLNTADQLKTEQVIATLAGRKPGNGNP